MLLPLFLALSLSAAPASEKLRVAAPSLSYANLDTTTGDFFLDALAQQLTKQGLVVVSQRDITAVLGLERQKQMLGTGGGEKADSMLELGQAFGVDGILTGSIGKTSGGFGVNVRIIRPGSGATLAAETGRLKTDDALLEWFDAAAGRLADELRAALKADAGAVARPEPEPEAVASVGATTGVKGSVPGSKPVDEPPPTAASSGTYEVLWNGSWYPAQVLERGKDGRSLIHYEGYSSSWDEWVSPARLKKTGAAVTPAEVAKPGAAPKTGAAIEVEWSGTWYPARVLEFRKADGHAYIQYDGYAESWNEWVPPARMRAPKK